MSELSYAPTDAGTSYDHRINMWTSREAKSEELRQHHLANWRSYWSWYRNYVVPIKDPAQWWRANESIPTPFKIVETILPRYLLGMFDQPDWYSVEARHMRVEEYETLCQRLLQQKLEQMKLFPKVYDALKYCTVMGHVWGKVTWEQAWMTRKVMLPVEAEDPETGEQVPGIQQDMIKERTFNGPQFSWLPLEKVWPDYTGRERWYIEQIDTTLEELEDVQENQQIYNKEEFANLRSSLSGAMFSEGDALGDARMGTSSASTVDVTQTVSTLEGIPWETVAPQREGIGVTLKQCWGWVPKSHRGEDGAEWRMLIIANGQFVLRDIPAPTPDGKPPYFAIRSIRIPGRLYGESILFYVGPMADQQTRLANMRIDEVFLGIWQSLLIRQGALASNNQMYFKPGGYLEVKGPPETKMQDLVSVVPRAPLLPQVWQEDAYRQTQAEHAAGASDIMQGVSDGDRQTATEVERKLQQGNARHVLQTMLFGYDFQKELLERTWEWLRMRMTEEEKVRLGEEYAAIDLRDIQAPIDIVIGGGFFTLSKANRAARSQLLVSMLQNPFFAQVAKPIPIFHQALQDQGYKNIERFMMTDQEFENEKARQQVQQILGGMSEGGEAPGIGGSPPAMPNMPQLGEGAGLGGGTAEGFGMEGAPL